MSSRSEIIARLKSGSQRLAAALADSDGLHGKLGEQDRLLAQLGNGGQIKLRVRMSGDGTRGKIEIVYERVGPEHDDDTAADE